MLAALAHNRTCDGDAWFGASGFGRRRVGVWGGSGSGVGLFGCVRVAAHATRGQGEGSGQRPAAGSWARARGRLGCASKASDLVGIAMQRPKAGSRKCGSQEIVDEMKLGGCICQGSTGWTGWMLGFAKMTGVHGEQEEQDAWARIRRWAGGCCRGVWPTAGPRQARNTPLGRRERSEKLDSG